MQNHGLIIQIYKDMQGLDVWTPRRLAGGHRLASWLRQHDWDMEVLDFGTWFTLEELQEFARSRITSDTKFVGFSCFFGTWTPIIEAFAQWIKQTYPDVTLICGGTPYPMVDCDVIDYHITGYAEHSMMQLLKVIAGNAPRSSLTLDPRYLGRKKVINSNAHYPAFPMHDINSYYEDRDFIDENEWLSIEASRGCKFKCKFCNFPVLGVKGDYTRDAEDFYENLQDNYDRFGVKNYYITDETFNDSTEKIKKYADMVERMDFDPYFSAYIRADLIVSRKEDREHLLRMGCLGHFYGIESTNPETLKVVGKGMHPDKLLPGILEAKNYFLTHNRKIYCATMSMIAGLPHETLQSLHKTIQWLVKNWTDQNVQWYSLEIPIKVDDNTESGILNEMSLDPAKYGYSIHEGTTLNDDYSVFVSPHLMNWKSDHMYRNQAQQFVQMIDRKYRWMRLNHMPLGVHFQARPGYGPDEILSKPYSPEVYDLASAWGRQMFENYKQRKLSWTPT